MPREYEQELLACLESAYSLIWGAQRIWRQGAQVKPRDYGPSNPQEPRIKNSMLQMTGIDLILNTFILFVILKDKILFLNVGHRKSAILDFYFLSAMFVYILHFL